MHHMPASRALTVASGGQRLRPHRGGLAMAWNLTGSYVETCSCELMCPCNLSFDHGATYDFCRVTLVFSVRNGDVEGTDIGGRPAAGVAGPPHGGDEGNPR